MVTARFYKLCFCNLSFNRLAQIGAIGTHRLAARETAETGGRTAIFRGLQKASGTAGLASSRHIHLHIHITKIICARADFSPHPNFNCQPYPRPRHCYCIDNCSSPSPNAHRIENPIPRPTNISHESAPTIPIIDQSAARS